jgi:site-specific DNA-methyltransferase (adenine-specific)
MEYNKVYKKDVILGIKDIPDNEIDIIICDPPYGILKDKEFGKEVYKEFDEYIKWCEEWIKECFRVLKGTGTFYIYGYNEILSHLSVKIPIDKQRFLVWYYTNKNMPSLNFWQRSHESILCCWKDKPIFNRDTVREPYTETFLKCNAGKKRVAGKSGRFGEKETIYNANAGGALPRDVIAIPTLAGGAALKERLMYCKTCNKKLLPTERKEHEDHDIIIHPTQKPNLLSDKLIKAARPDGVFKVLVPFCGSGSECISVLDNGGEFISFEINDDYLKLAEESLNILHKVYGAS